MSRTIQDARVLESGTRDGVIRVAIVDDYPVLLAGMRQSLTLSEDIVVVAEYTRVADLLGQVVSDRPEIILLGCESNLENLSQQLHSVVERCPEVRVIVFTGNVNVNFHEAALRNGAKGILLKHCPPEWIGKTVRKVAQGDLCFDPALTHRVLSTFVQHKPAALPAAKAGIASLTERETQIIRLICQGLRNKEIAGKLYISDATVAHHLTSIYRKLGLADRTELLLYAHHNGISTLKAAS
jgi:DNA-binding NarL/FixJ family response regulator